MVFGRHKAEKIRQNFLSSLGGEWENPLLHRSQDDLRSFPTTREPADVDTVAAESGLANSHAIALPVSFRERRLRESRARSAMADGDRHA